jgi:hypothetical protein
MMLQDRNITVQAIIREEEVAVGPKCIKKADSKATIKNLDLAAPDFILHPTAWKPWILPRAPITLKSSHSMNILREQLGINRRDLTSGIHR